MKYYLIAYAWEDSEFRWHFENAVTLKTPAEWLLETRSYASKNTLLMHTEITEDVYRELKGRIG